MSDSKHAILSALRVQHPPDAALPDLADGQWITFADPAAQFNTVLVAVGGNCVFAPMIEEVRHELERLPAYSTAAKVYSLVPGIESRNVDPHAIADPHELEDIDFAVLPGRFSVAENAAVWVTDEGVPHRAIYIIAQHVALVVPATEIVHNMHQAYERLRFERPGFGCFISGPSKTADIEQSLVIGAHGARSLTVFLMKQFV
ncbi:MAG: LUD domain-containing protein [Pirellulales bacterium]